MSQKFYRKILSNGMTVLFEKRDVPVVSVAIAVKCGGIHESEEEKGISHFIEHLVYKGTKNRTYKQINEEIERNGGELNGFTSETVTAFWCKMPKIHLDIALDVLSDLVKNPLFNEEDIEKERKVILEEMKMYSDSPRHYVFEKINGLLYEKPFGIPLIGTENSLKNINREKILDRFNSIYRPNNMILCVVGNADWKTILNFAKKNFDNEKGILPKFKIKTKNGVMAEKRKGVDQANFILAFHSPLANDKKSYATQVLMTLMAGGMSSRLFDEIREKRQLSYVVKGDTSISKFYSFSFVFVGSKKENVEKIKKLILKEFENVSKNLSEEELKKIKEQMIGNYQISMEDSSSHLVNLLSYELDGNAEEFYEFEKKIENVKLSEVKSVSKIKDYSFFALLPE